MITKWISAYRIGFIKTIVYMLQASEYKLGDYLSWLKRVKSFRRVMYRKDLVLTTKAKLLIFVLRIMLISIVILMAAILLITNLYFPIKIIIALMILLLTPLILSIGILLPLWLGYILIQKPKEKIIISNAKKKLSQNKAIKIAIAGSFGKTTLREILLSILSADKKVASPPSSYNTPLGISKFINNLSGNEDVIIFELGEYYPGDVKFLTEIINPDIGIITGVNEAHLSKFKNIESTQATIFELADYLGASSRLYINEDNELANERASKYSSILYSSKGCGDMKVKSSKADLNGIDFSVSYNKDNINFHSDLIGKHLLGSLICSIDIAHSLGIDFNKIKKGVASTKSFDHRMQPRIVDGALIIDDTYNGNYDGIMAGLNLLDSANAKNRKIYVTPGLVEQGKMSHEIHKKIGVKIAEVNPDIVVLMNNSVTNYIVEGLKDKGYKGDLRIENDPKKFYENIGMFVATGDVLLMQNDWPDSYN